MNILGSQRSLTSSRLTGTIASSRSEASPARYLITAVRAKKDFSEASPARYLITAVRAKKDFSEASPARYLITANRTK
jgi:hypothetical protein